MIYIVTALAAEAKPVVKHLKLKLIAQKPYEIYAAEKYRLIISGMGRDQALMATTHLLSTFSPSPNDILVNIGIAAAQPTHLIGDAFIAHTLTDTLSGKHFYPDMRMDHPFKELALSTVDAPLDAKSPYESADMESFFIYKAALNYLSSAQIIIFKVISDHFSSAIPSKEAVFGWIEAHLEELFVQLENLEEKFPHKVAFSGLLQKEALKLIEALQLTKAQSDRLNDALKGYILRHKKEPLLPKYLPIQHKKEQKDAFAKIITLLAS